MGDWRVGAVMVELMCKNDPSFSSSFLLYEPAHSEFFPRSHVARELTYLTTQSCSQNAAMISAQLPSFFLFFFNHRSLESPFYQLKCS